MNAIFIDKVRRARQTQMDQKMLDGPRLFDLNCQIMRSGIRTQFPNYDEEQVQKELRRRLAIQRRMGHGPFGVDSEYDRKLALRVL